MVIGWDAADWKVIRPLLDAGLMPNLAGLMARGVHGNNTTLYPPFSPTLWTSIATGKRPYKHGILGFTEPTKDGNIRPCTVLSRTTKALWNILAQNGKRSVVVGWWPSHPAEPIPGAMVSNHFQHINKEPGSALPPLTEAKVQPPSLIDSLSELRVRPWEIPLEILRLFVPKADAVDQANDTSLHDLASILAETLSIHAAGTELVEHQDWDLAAVYFDTIDHVGHRFMSFHPPRQAHVDPAAFELYSEIINNTYRHHDAMLGRYLELAGPDTHVIVLSDHGFHSDERRPSWIPAEPAGPAAEHRRLGIFVMAGPGIRQGARIHGSSVLDLTPTVLTLFGLPVGEDMDGTPQVQAWIQRPEIRRIPSWDDVPGEDGRHPPHTEEDPRAAAAELEQLIALGYVAPPPKNKQNALRETVRELDFNRARSLADGGKLQESLPIFERLWSEWPDDHRFGLHLLDVLGATGRIPERRIALNTLKERAETLAKKASEELKRRESLEAERKKKSSADPKAAARREKSPAARRKRFERRRLIEQSWGLNLTRAEIGQFLLEGNKEAALAAIAPLLDGRNLPITIVPFLATTLVSLGRDAEALQLIEILETTDPESPTPHSLRADIFFRAGNHAGVLESAARSLGLVYFNPSLHTVMAISLVHLGRRDEAINQLRVALQQNPSHLLAIRTLESLCANDPELAFTLASWRIATQAKMVTRATEGATPARPETAADYDFTALCERDPAEASPLAPEEVVIVSGLPRSGTSMLMRALRGGGLTVLEDGARQADENNRLGYFELERVKSLATDATWLSEARGKVLKVVAPLLRHVPKSVAARVLVLHRPLPQVLASQGAMKDRLGTNTRDISPALLSAGYASQMRGLDGLIAERGAWSVLHVSYEAMLADPAGQSRRIARFLGGGIDAEAAASCVDPSQRRFA